MISATVPAEHAPLMEERTIFGVAAIPKTGKTAVKSCLKKMAPTTKNREARKGCAAKAPGSSAKAIIACKEYELTKYVMIVHTLLALSS